MNYLFARDDLIYVKSNNRSFLWAYAEQSSDLQYIVTSINCSKFQIRPDFCPKSGASLEIVIEVALHICIIYILHYALVLSSVLIR